MVRATDHAEASVAPPAAPTTAADGNAAGPIDTLPSAVRDFEGIIEALQGLTPILCLDFDGTLSPIVEDPKSAQLLEGVEPVLRGLAERVPVFVLSGRDAVDVHERIHLPRIIYAGSHGFEIVHEDGTREPHAEAMPFLPHLNAIEVELTAATADIPGVVIDRKRFGLAVHDRAVPDEHLEALWAIVSGIGANYPMLRAMRGKRVTEFLPNLDWNKGRALLWLLDIVGFDPTRHLPICIGDDVTDEDALRAIRGRGVGIVVGSGQRYTAATYAVRDPVEVWEFLMRLARLLDERAPSVDNPPADNEAAGA